MSYIPCDTPVPTGTGLCIPLQGGGLAPFRSAIRSRAAGQVDSADAAGSTSSTLDDSRAGFPQGGAGYSLPDLSFNLPEITLREQSRTTGLTQAQMRELAEAPEMVNENEVKFCSVEVREKDIVRGPVSAPPWGDIMARGSQAPDITPQSYTWIEWVQDNPWLAVGLVLVGGVFVKSVMDERSGRSTARFF